MPVSTLDERAALIAIDFQSATMGIPSVDPIGPVAQNAALLAGKFRALGLPVILVNVAGVPTGRTQEPGHTGPLPEEWTILASELGADESDHLITKHAWDAFSGTSLNEVLEKAGTTQVFLAGITTSRGVESTARTAHSLGYHVALVTDAMTDMSLESQQNSFERIFPVLGETGTTAEVVALLDGRKA